MDFPQVKIYFLFFRNHNPSLRRGSCPHEPIFATQLHADSCGHEPRQSKLPNNQKIEHQRLWKSYIKKTNIFDKKNENEPLNLLQDLSSNL